MTEESSDTKPPTLSKKEVTDRTVTAADRTLLILNAFADRRVTLSLTELSEETGLFKSVILRYMLSFEKYGYVQRLEDGGYRLGTRIVELAHAFEQNLNQREAIDACLLQLVKVTQESAFFYIREGDRRLCLMGRYSPHSLRVNLRIGTSTPLDETSISQVLTSYDLPSHAITRYDASMVRSSKGFHDPLTTSISAPILGLSGRLVGAISISGPTHRLDPGHQEHLLTVLGEARSLSKALGFTND